MRTLRLHEDRADVYLTTDGYDDVSPDGDEERLTRYRWDGELHAMGEEGITDRGAEPFDLASVDPSRFGGMCADVRALVEDPDDSSLSISRPQPAAGDEDQAVGWITAQADNDRGEVALISFDLDGDEVRRSAG
ncbi:hypothetical protein E7Z54_01260 [Nocardioides sp.]|nr:hypothetical protein E7Z54_01260 [Nocardioides sp.]